MANRFNSTNYNPSSSPTNSSSDDFKDRDSLLLGRYSIVEATLASTSVYDGSYGKSMILNMDDLEVLQGVITERVENGDGVADEKTKIMGWETWFDTDEDMNLIPFDEGGEISIDEVGRRVTQEAGGDQYKYQVQEGVLEDRGDDPVPLGDFDLWLGNGKKARTMAKVLSDHGHDIISEADKQDDHSWLNADSADEFALRDELEGERIMFWFEQTTLTPDDIDDLDSEVTFTDAVVLDGESETPITIPNSDTTPDESDDTESVESRNSEPDPDTTNDADIPDSVEDLLDMFARTENTERDSVERMVKSEAPDDYEIDLDVMIDEIEARM